MRALITGGAGFVGSHLGEALLKRGADVEIIDDLSTGSINNIEHLKGLKHFCYGIDTLLNRPYLAELIDRADVIFHLAAAVGVRLIVESPVRTTETNVRGTELVLELAAKKSKKVVLTSTSEVEVYGKANKIPFSEDDDLVLGPTVKGRWSYASSKASTSSWPSLTGRRRAFRWSLAACSTRLAPGKPGGTEWSSRRSSSKHSAVVPSPCSVMGSSRGASLGLAMS